MAKSNHLKNIIQKFDALDKSQLQANTEALHAKISAELEAQIKAEQEFSMPAMQDVQLSLTDYLEAVKLVVSETFNHEVWVRAEIRSVSSKGGHYYFELAEKDDTGQIVASCRATLWRYKASSVISKFLQSTGKPLEAGIMVLLKAAANFHPQYGFSINISDIDPNYTLGALAMAYNAMLRKLHDEGLTTLNKQLPMPFDIRHVIVIAPENAAGLGDFRAEADRLQTYGACHFYYHHATFQGNHAPTEIRHAISQAQNDFYKTHHFWADLLVIIRGGGAVGDLAYLNDYELAALVAEQPNPVWVGIGHERDKVLLDEVAHTRFDTPSKVIAAIENHLIAVCSQAKNAMMQIKNISTANVLLSKNNCQKLMHQIRSNTIKELEIAKHRTQQKLDASKSSARHHINTYHSNLNVLKLQTKQQATLALEKYKIKINQHLKTHKDIKSQLTTLSEQCRFYQSMILIQHPKRTLSKGYAIVWQNQAIVQSADGVSRGEIRIQFHDGMVKAVVD